jgi:hypothetical protein
MKMGKTKQLKNYLVNNPTNRVLFISFRKTFSNEIKTKFPEFQSYIDQTNLNIDKLIIQVDSLHKLDLIPYDLLILDECESIFNQLKSIQIKNITEVIAN